MSINALMHELDATNVWRPVHGSGGTISTNSSSANIGISGVFTGTGIDVSQYGTISVAIQASHNSATGGLAFQGSFDNVTWFDMETYSYVATGLKIYSMAPAGKYFRVKYTNGSVATTAFNLLTTVTNAYTKPSSQRIGDTITAENDAELVKSILAAKKPNGEFTDIDCTAGGNLKVSVEESEAIINFPSANLGPFGDLETMELVPVFHLSFATGIRTQLLTSSVANSATVDTNAGRLRLQSGTNAAGSAIAYSNRPVSYRPGQGVVARFTALFTLGVASSTQIAGMGNAVDGYFFGYNGAAFGILYRANSVDTWIAQDDWNGDTCDGRGTSRFTLDPAMGVPLMIKYPYLGYGNIRFFIQDPATSLWILVHTIKYANTSASVQVTNPCLNFYAQALNTGSGTNKILYVGSVGVFNPGIRAFLGPQFTTSTAKASVTTQTNVITLKSATSVNGVANRGLARLRQFSAFTDAVNGYATIRLIKNTTLGGSPSYSAINGATADGGVTITSAQSTVSQDTAGTTITGGEVVWSIVVFNDSTGIIDLIAQDIWLAPTETLTVSATATSTATIGVALNWSEDVQ